MVHTGRQIRRRFGNRGLVIALVLVALAVIGGVVLLIS
jgi:hypothetical protein